MHPLRRKRLQNDFSLDDLARLTGIDSSTISRLEHCQRKLTDEHLRRCAKALNCQEQELIPSQEEVDAIRGKTHV
jgi:transcriptional regulator with XRE-family HTH domain